MSTKSFDSVTQKAIKTNDFVLEWTTVKTDRTVNDDGDKLIIIILTCSNGS